MPSGRVPTARSAEGFAQSTRDNVDAIHHLMMFMSPPAIRTHEANRMRIVHHQHCIVFVGKLAEVGKFRDVAIHGEDAVGCDESRARLSSRFEASFGVIHVAVGVALALCFTESDSVNDACVV